MVPHGSLQPMKGAAHRDSPILHLIPHLVSSCRRGERQRQRERERNRLQSSTSICSSPVTRADALVLSSTPSLELQEKNLRAWTALHLLLEAMCLQDALGRFGRWVHVKASYSPSEPSEMCKCCFGAEKCSQCDCLAGCLHENTSAASIMLVKPS